MLLDGPRRWEAAHGSDDSAISALRRKRRSAILRRRDDFVLEFCELIKNENLDLYERLISKIVGDFVFDVVNAYSVSK